MALSLEDRIRLANLELLFEALNADPPEPDDEPVPEPEPEKE
jgi:hypothetical protein